MELIGDLLIGVHDDRIDEEIELHSKRLDAFKDTFGDTDWRTEALLATYRKLLAPGTTYSYIIAGMYLRWAMLNPGEVGVETPNRDCECIGGWVHDSGSTKDRDDVYRPCHKCLPGMHDRWQEESGHLYG